MSEAGKERMYARQRVTGNRAGLDVLRAKRGKLSDLLGAMETREAQANRISNERIDAAVAASPTLRGTGRPAADGETWEAPAEVAELLAALTGGGDGQGTATATATTTGTTGTTEGS